MSTQLVEQALATIEDALAKPPLELTDEIDTAERLVAALRDELIERLRAGPDAAEAPRLRAALTRANTALSLILGVEYAVAGIQRGPLEPARDQLRQVEEYLR